jgi:hypothetical protein
MALTPSLAQIRPRGHDSHFGNAVLRKMLASDSERSAAAFQSRALAQTFPKPSIPGKALPEKEKVDLERISTVQKQRPL